MNAAQQPAESNIWLGAPRWGRPLLMAGAPRGIAIINGTAAAAVGLGMQMWAAGIVLGLIGHAAAVYAAKKDPKFLEVGVRHLKHGQYLSC